MGSASRSQMKLDSDIIRKQAARIRELSDEVVRHCQTIDQRDAHIRELVSLRAGNNALKNEIERLRKQLEQAAFVSQHSGRAETEYEVAALRARLERALELLDAVTVCPESSHCDGEAYPTEPHGEGQQCMWHDHLRKLRGGDDECRHCEFDDGGTDGQPRCIRCGAREKEDK